MSHHFKTHVCTFGMMFFLILSATAQDSYAQRRKPALGGAADTAKNDTNKAGSGTKQGRGNSSPLQPNPRSDANKRTAAQQKESEPITVTMEVKEDGIQLVATWFPPIIEESEKGGLGKPATPTARVLPGMAAGDTNAKPTAIEKETEPGKEVAPFILVHDWTRSRQDLLMMAKFLQSQGHAVLVPDLRGHGESVNVKNAKVTLDHTKFRKNQIGLAVRDIDQCKRFLQTKNNEGILNIDLLNVVAVGDSAHLAIAWSIADWSWAPAGGVKQGQDVKSLILFSPTEKFAGSSLAKLQRSPLLSGKVGTPLPMLVIWGGQADVAGSCRQFIDDLRKTRPEAPTSDDMATRWQKQNLFEYAAPTNMSGVQLAGMPDARELWVFANNFVSQKVLAYKDQCEWQLRGAEAILNR